MKHMLLNLTLAVTALIAVTAQSEELSLRDRISGYSFAQGVYTDTASQGSDQYLEHWRVEPHLRLSPKWTVMTLLDLALISDNDKPGDNWLQQAEIRYQVNDRLKLHAGLLFNSVGCATPSPYNLKTVKYPKAKVYGAYAYGVQATYSLGASTKITTDIGAQTGFVFDDDAAFDRVESSMRIKHSISETRYAAISTQVNSTRTRAAIDWGGTVDDNQKWSIIGGTFVDRQDDTGTNYSAYNLLNWAASKYLHLHTQLDWCSQVERTDDLIWTNGVQIFPIKGVSLTIDYESASGAVDNRLLAQLHYMVYF